MTQERPMYELEYPAPQVNGEPQNGPALIVAMHGYADAGHAIESAADHLKAALESRTCLLYTSDAADE